MLHRVIPVFIVALAVGCGGVTELKGDGAVGGSGGTGTGTGGDGSGGTGPTTAGVTTAAVTTAAVTTAGTTSGGGNAAISAVASATTTDWSTTGLNCGGVECGATQCHDGQLVVLPGECCPVCVCSEVMCASPDCPNGRVETPPGYCCPQCVEALCDGVMCDAPYDCGAGRTFTRPDGACCAGCMPDDPGSVGCVDIACPVDNICAKGFQRGDLMGACCYECLPDPLYCETNDDCVIADRPRSCCGCPEVISTRALNDDACWTPVADPRPIPDACYPEVTCDRECDLCADPGAAVCVNSRCTQEILE